MALRLGELSAVISADSSGFDRGIDRSERRFDRFGVRIAEAAGAAEAAASDGGGRAGVALGDGFFRAADGRLRDARGRFVAEIGQMASAAASGGGALSGIGRSASGSSGPVGMLIGVITALAGSLAVAAPAAYALGSAIGSIPALAAGGGAAIATLGIGFLGIADAFKKTTRAGGGAANTADRVASAERGLAQAQREATRAQQDLSRAREEAVEGIEDLDRSLRRAKISEAQATRELERAGEALSKARRGGNIDKIREAELAYDDAALSVEEAKDRTGDLTKEQERSAAAGVEGSDKVVAALDRQQQATDRLADAEAALRQARQGSGGGGGAAQDVMRLAASAQDAVNAIKGLKPAFEDLRLSVQQRLFAGVGDEIRKIADVWIPQAKKTLGSFADTFNGIFKTFSSSIREPAFVQNMANAAESVRAMLEKIGNAAAGPLVDALGRLADAARPFVDALGTGIAGAIERFSAWIKRLDEEGKLDEFFSRGADALKTFGSIGESVISIIGSIFSILFGADAKQGGDTPFKTAAESLRGFADKLADPEYQKKAQEWVARIERLINAALRFGSFLGDVGDASTAYADAVGGAWDKVIGFFGSLPEKFDTVINWFRDAPGRIGEFLAGLPDQLGTFFTDMLTGLAEKVGFGVGWVIGFFMALPGRIGEFLAGLPQQLSDLFSRAWSWAKDAVGRGIDKMIEFVKTLPGKLRRIGPDIIQGLVDGVNDVAHKLWDLAKGMAKRFVDGFKRGIDSHSPSKVFYSIAVDGIGAGLINGITSLDRPVGRAGEGLAAMVTDPVAAAVGPRGPVAATVPSGGSSGTGLNVTRVDGRIVLEGTGLLRGLREVIAVQGGNVQAVLGA